MWTESIKEEKFVSNQNSPSNLRQTESRQPAMGLPKAWHFAKWNNVPRSLVMVLLTCSLVSQTGCQIFQRFRTDTNAPPIVFEQAPNQSQIIAHLRAQSEKVKQLKTNVRVSMDGLPTLRGTLTVERPKRLRLKAGLLGVNEMGVDVGSNDDFFWVWSKASLPGQTPTLMYANHEKFKNSPVRNALSLEPSWIIDALGFVEFSPNDRHEGPFPRQDGRFEIRTYQQTPQGPTARLSVVDPKHGWISQQSIYGPKGNLIAYVDSIKHKLYPEFGVSLPQRFEIHVYQPNGQKMKLIVDADDYTVNSLYGDPEKLWTMPNPVDIPKIDLTQVSQSTISAGATPAANAGMNPQGNQRFSSKQRFFNR